MPQALYRHYDQEALDAQINLRARWPDFQDHFDRWAADSAAARQVLSGRLDLVYGGSAGQKLDLFPARNADGAGPPPLLAFIHGGYWQALDKSDYSYLAPPFVDAGIAFASLNYDLAPDVSVEEIVGQVRAALAWLYREAAAGGYDGARIFVAGHSAGGHLTVEAMTTDWVSSYDLPQDVVKGGCAISGIYELEPIRLSYQQEILGLDPDMVARISPMRHPPARAGPLICAVGSEETDEFLAQQREFLEVWRDAGLRARAIDLPGRTHFTAVDALGEANHPLFAAVRDLVLSRRGPAG